MATSAREIKAGKVPVANVSTPGDLLENANFARFLRAIDDLVDAGAGDLPNLIAAQIGKLVAQHGWLPPQCCEPGEECYRRHLLYADPAGRYTVLALVWRPGQTTPVHGHTAWGAVGVYEGHPSVAVYQYSDGSQPSMKGEFHCCPGEVSHVVEGVDEPHRIFNASDDIAITIHTYGRDLTEDPCCINILL